MRFRLLTRNEITLDHEIIWSSVTLLAVLAGLLIFWLPGLVAACPLKALTGLPCCSCGATRAFLALVKGDALGALRLNPLFTLIYMGAAAYAVYGFTVVALGLRRIRISITSRPAAIALWAAIPVAVVVNWAYLVCAGI